MTTFAQLMSRPPLKYKAYRPRSGPVKTWALLPQNSEPGWHWMKRVQCFLQEQFDKQLLFRVFGRWNLVMFCSKWINKFTYLIKLKKNENKSTKSLHFVYNSTLKSEIDSTWKRCHRGSGSQTARWSDQWYGVSALIVKVPYFLSDEMKLEIIWILYVKKIVISFFENMT